MSKNTIIRFPEQMTMERTLTRITNGLNNGLLCVSLGLGLMTILWGMTEKEVDKLQAENRRLAREIDNVRDEIEVLKDKEGRMQM